MNSFRRIFFMFLSVAVISAYGEDVSANEKLIEACFAEDNPETLKAALLDEKADINAKHGSSGQTCLMGSVLRGYTKNVKFMIELGADSSIGEMQGYLPPHGAGFQGRPEIMQLLADSGMDVNEFHKDGFTPLHRTCWGSEERHALTFQVLVQLGVDPEFPSESGKTCREMTKNEWILKLLEKSNTEEL